MAEKHDLPLLNPVLRLRMEPAHKVPTGGGKGRSSVVNDRLEGQKAKLGEQAQKLHSSRADFVTFGKKTLLAVRMFSDSLSKGHSPTDLFSAVNGCQFVAPLHKGYLIEADLGQFNRVLAKITNAGSFVIQADISRVSDMEIFNEDQRMHGRSINELWETAPESEDGRLFIVWLAPFRDHEAREALMKKIMVLSHDRTMLPVFSRVLSTRPMGTTKQVGTLSAIPRQSTIARAIRSYRNTGIGYATILVSNKDCLGELVASGTISRIDPVRKLESTSPGEGSHPAPPYKPGNDPVIAVVDGGLHAPEYKAAEDWRVQPLVPDNDADKQHGNGVSSLAIHAHAWNNNRNLPVLECRIGTVQAVQRRSSILPIFEQELIDYLVKAVGEHPEVKIWNISANQSGGVDHEDVSILGAGLRKIARDHNILPIISIGNVGNNNSDRPDPPADCEAAIVVGGREADINGNPAVACSNCLTGPGPGGMLKPDMSWFSELRMWGGKVDIGSSYATPLISSLAAHTFEALRNPTPDLVKALLIHAAELDVHEPALGWGTPYNGHMPWICAPGSVTFAWCAKLEPGISYYWNEIPIPPEIVRKERLSGKARMTAILNPLVSPFAGANYFASRLEVALQYQNKSGDEWKSLLGPLKEATIPESDSRKELRKWQPIRRHTRDFSERGHQFAGKNLRLYARVFTRDLYQFGWSHHSQAGPQEVTFVLTFWSGDQQPSIYDSSVQAMGAFVESAVLEQEIEQEIEL